MLKHGKSLNTSTGFLSKSHALTVRGKIQNYISSRNKINQNKIQNHE